MKKSLKKNVLLIQDAAKFKQQSAGESFRRKIAIVQKFRVEVTMDTQSTHHSQAKHAHAIDL